jgi:hypothetical protein
MTLNTGIDLYRKNPGWIENLGFTFASNTFTVTGANGVSLGSRNASYVGLPSLVTPGVFKTYRITTSQNFIDTNGASTIDGNLFGFLTGDVQSTDVPFFLYAVSNSAAGTPETTINFMISRQAGRVTSPVAGDIGKTGSAIADNEWSFFALGNPTVADYASSPCLMLGSFRMTKVATNDGWVVSTLGLTDGIGTFQENVRFFLDTGVLGAKAGSHWRNNGGTAPTFNDAENSYFITPDGYIDANYTGSTTSVNGVGAVTSQLIVPMRSDYLTVSGEPIHTNGKQILSTPQTRAIIPTVLESASIATMAFVSSTVDGPLTNANMAAATTSMNISCYYRPATETP